MAYPNIKRLRFSFFVKVLLEGMSLNTSGYNNLTKLEWIRQSVHAWWQIYNDIKTTSINQLEAFHNRLWVSWFDISIETLNKVFVLRGKSVVTAET